LTRSIDAPDGGPHRIVEVEGLAIMAIPCADRRRKWKTNPAFGQELEALSAEYEPARALIEARARARLSRSEVAARMGTSQPA